MGDKIADQVRRLPGSSLTLIKVSGQEQIVRVSTVLYILYGNLELGYI